MSWTFYDANGTLLQGLGPDTVTSAHIVDGTIVNADINASAAIAKTKLAALNVLNADVNASAAIAYTKLAALADGNILVGNGSNAAVSVNPSGDIDISNAGAFTIATDAVTTAKIANDQVTGAKLNPALVAGDIIYADGTDTITKLAKPGTPAGEVLTFATSASAPSWVAASAGVGLGLVIALGG